MELTTVWFVLIAVLWTGYFVLEGFDFGVGMLLPVLGRDDRERRVMINTIGPVWDGNEVWLITAGGATFAAFPEWYATLFSGFYLPLLLILLALIVRGVAFEYRGKRARARPGSAAGTCAIVVGSVVPAFLWGVAFANIVRGVPLDADHEYTGSLLDLLNPYALLGGLTHARRCSSLHGAVFLALKTTGEIRDRANAARRPRRARAPRSLAVAFLAWTLLGIRRTPAAVGARRWSRPSRWSRGLVAEPGAPGGLGVRRHRRGDRADRGDAVRRAVPRRAALDDRPGGHA